MKSIPRKLPRRLLAWALSLAFAAVPIGGSANHSWGGYHWARTTSSFTLTLGDNASSTWDPYLATTSSDWSKSSVLDTTIAPGGTTARRCRATNGRVEVCNEKYGNNGWLGVAQIWISGSHITQGTVKVNDTYFNTAKYDKPEWRNLVMCQEVGHTLGLDHQNTDFTNTNLGTCMDYTNNPLGPPDNEHPNQHDYDELVTIYKHLDSYTSASSQTSNSAAAMPSAMTEIDYSERAQWGTLLRSSKNGLLEVYMLEFGRAHKIFTFVIWAEGQGRGR
ncbi:MAG: hypothetical protein HYX46_05805 [Betaproteobacteria bacterium]|nr:hypothetical protein [Betaproteobacteria bacterium]